MAAAISPHTLPVLPLTAVLKRWTSTIPLCPLTESVDFQPNFTAFQPSTFAHGWSLEPSMAMPLPSTNERYCQPPERLSTIRLPNVWKSPLTSSFGYDVLAAGWMVMTGRPIPSACAVPAMSMPPPRSVAADAISAAERFNMLCIVFSLPLNLMFGMVLEKRY